MKTITKYIAYDGAEFTNEAGCIAHEALCKEIDEIMATLPKRPRDDNCNFSNGHGYLQHSPTTFWPARDALLRIANRISPHKWFNQALSDRSIHASWAGRIISETIDPLYRRAWCRISCVDSQLREWGQPYYADHPDEATEQRELPPA